MKKQYKAPALSIVKIGTQSLMVLSQDNPQTVVNHNAFDEEFGSRYHNSLWDDDDDDFDF